MRRYRLTLQAKLDLTEISGYLQSAPKISRQRVFGEIDRGLERICDFPDSGQIEPEQFFSRGKIVRSMLVASYRIYYLPSDLPITVFAVLHGARDIAATLRGREQT